MRNRIKEAFRIIFRLPASRLSRSIVLYVFLSVIVIETIIFIPSYQYRKRELLAHFKAVSAAKISCLLDVQAAETSPEMLFRRVRLFSKPPLVLGAALYETDGKRLAGFGEAPRPPVFTEDRSRPSDWLNAETYRCDLAFPVTIKNREYTLILRQDASPVKEALIAFFFRIVGLVVIISLFVTAGAWAALGPMVVTPIIRLRSDLVRAGKSISRAKTTFAFDSDPAARRDELGDVISAFRKMVRQISDAIEKRQLAEDRLKESYRQVSEYSRTLDNELSSGRNMQQNFLPAQLLKLPGWEFAAFFRPARQVSGDFYDVFSFADGRVGLVIADVCDKGVGAALFMALFRSLVRIFSGQFEAARWPASQRSLSVRPPDPAGGEDEKRQLRRRVRQTVELTNKYIADNHGDLGMFATLFFGVLDPDTGVLTYLNGGHEPPLITRASGGIKSFLRPTGPAVGVQANLTFGVSEALLEPGETLLGFTDGVTEAASPGGFFFDRHRLTTLLDPPSGSAEKLIGKIAAAVETHIGRGEQFDDIALMAVRRQQG